MDSKRLGKLGEDMAVGYLKSQRYKILDRNFSYRISGVLRGEIDIVAQKDGVICFVEVKAVAHNKDFLAQDKVDFKKQWRLKKAAEIWLSKRKIPFSRKWQIDVIAVSFGQDSSQPQIEHSPNAVSD